MKLEIPKTYNPQEVEDEIYKKWEESGKFNPDNLELSENADKFSISMPPPNATGVLHLGHASMLAYQDLMIRYNRMCGKNVLWLPGTDHASIATQTKVEKIIAGEGKTKYDLGREKFLERVNEYVENSKNTIRNQTKKMGSSCDWERERYTLDNGLSRAVREVFVKMYDDELIYRGDRIVNWCPRCESTLADDEVEHKDQKANLYYFKYEKDFPITIATTRPETKLGDTAVAVNPKYEKYQKYIGQIFEIDLGNGVHQIKIIADREVDMEFGTGALGVTPAHSMTDWEMAEKNGLRKIKIIGEDGKMNANAGADYEGLTVLEAREKFVKYLEKNELIEKVEEVDQSLSICYRCDTPIEPLPSKQWFVAVDKKITIEGNKYFQNKSLKEVALEVVNKAEEKNEDKIEIIPERFSKTYHNWMENLHDWCISRQLWFGHRIPVWYDIFDKNNKCGEIIFNAPFLFIKGDIYETVKKLEENGYSENFCANASAKKNGFYIHRASFDALKGLIELKMTTITEVKKILKSLLSERCEKPIVKAEGNIVPETAVQDPDTLDTWFSSGLWTFSTLLDQDHQKYETFEEWVVNSPDLKNFHPTSVMETGYDILFFWIARMILMTTYTLGEVPFENVYLHGMVRDKQGKKMSKSLGNGIDPIKMIEKYGTDALRLSMIIGSSPGNDIKMYEEKIEGYRNFVNKLWNVSRFIITNYELRTTNYEIDSKNCSTADLWILKKMMNLIHQVNFDLMNYNFSSSGEKLRDFTWNDLADWYIEISKTENDEQKEVILNVILRDLLKLWHPFIPFVTEAIWQGIDEQFLMVEKWPTQDKYERIIRGTDATYYLEPVIGIIKSIRNARAEYKIEPSQKIDIIIYAGEQKEFIKSQAHLIKGMRTGIGALEIKEKGEKIKDAVYVIVGDVEVYLIGMINKEKEKKNLENEIENIEKYVEQIRKKLGNDNFVENAPMEVVEKEREKYQESMAKVEKLKMKLESLDS